MRLSKAQCNALKTIAAGKVRFCDRTPYNPNHIRLDVLRYLKLKNLICLQWRNKKKMQGVYRLTQEGEIVLTLQKLKEKKNDH